MSFLHNQVLTTDEKREFQCLRQHVYLDSDSFCATVEELEDGSRAVRLGLLLTARRNIYGHPCMCQAKKESFSKILSTLTTKDFQCPM